MSDTPLPADLALARRLDRGERPDGSDALHGVLQSLRPEARLDAAVSARLWEAVAAEVQPARPARRAADRPALRPSRLRPVRLHLARWAVAAVAGLALGVATWTWMQGPEVVAVAGAAIRVVETPDGSTVTLRPHTRLVRHGARAYGVEGEAFFAVAPDPDRPFTVEAGAGTVRVLGTRFDVSTWGDRTEVYVDEGRVEVRGRLAEGVVLSAGEAAAVDASGVPAASPKAAAAALDWQRGVAVFDSEPARRVADEIGQHFGVSVTLPTALSGERISGVVALESAPDALDGLGRILGGRFEPTRGAAYRFVGS